MRVWVWGPNEPIRSLVTPPHIHTHTHTHTPPPPSTLCMQGYSAVGKHAWEAQAIPGGYTPLHFAAQNLDLGAIEMLLRHKASTHLKNTVMHVAVGAGRLSGDC